MLEVPPVDFGQPLSLGPLLERAAAAVPDKTALVGARGRLTYAELADEVSRTAAALNELGVRAGDRVAVSLANDIDIVTALMGIWAQGAVFVGVHTVLAPPEKRYLVDDCEPSLYITADADDDVGAPRVIVLDEWRARVAGADPLTPWPQSDPLAVAAIAYTSGTTGNPKGVMHSQHNALLPGAVAVARGSYDADDVFLCVQPLTILNLQVLNPLTTAQALGTCCIANRHDPVSLARWIKQEGVTHFAVVPTVAYDLLTHPDVNPEDLATLTKPRVGGAAMPESVKLLFEERFGIKPATSYALTEGPTLVTRQDPDRPIIEGSCGQALPHIDVQVLDDDDRPAEVGEVGEICFGPRPEGPWAGVYRTMLGYWGRPELSAEVLRDGMVHSGDLGRFDSNGELFIVERRSQMIIRGGNNIYPAEIERVLGADSRVAECCVVGRPDDRLGEAVVAFVQSAPGVAVGAEDLIALCQANLAPYKVPDEVCFVEAFPRSPLGKIARAQVQAI
ncbi:MAG: long-chain fatty acid--CoA ligase [Acidimicrobiia bacterium]|nr:long-chain fatty acid--CoA ligase [Acidimicrobiia bacterium]